MGKNNLMSQAEELEALLTAAPRAYPAVPHIDESYLVAAAPTESPEATAAMENDELLPELVRSIVDYAVRRAPANASARHIGEAIGVGVVAAVDQLKLNDVKVVEAVDVFLSELCESVRDTLSME